MSELGSVQFFLGEKVVFTIEKILWEDKHSAVVTLVTRDSPVTINKVSNSGRECVTNAACTFFPYEKPLDDKIGEAYREWRGSNWSEDERLFYEKFKSSKAGYLEDNKEWPKVFYAGYMTAKKEYENG